MTDQRTEQERDSGGRWGRTPYRPEALENQYGTSDGHTASRLDVTCPGCGKDWSPVSSCCIKGGSRTASPFCPNCGTDFRASEDDIETHQLTQARAQTEDAAEKLREFIEETPGLSAVGEKTVIRENQEGR